MKNVVFVQVGFEFDSSVYLPYAAGTLIAYCQQDETIRKEYDFSRIIDIKSLPTGIDFAKLNLFDY